ADLRVLRAADAALPELQRRAQCVSPGTSGGPGSDGVAGSDGVTGSEGVVGREGVAGNDGGVGKLGGLTVGRLGVFGAETEAVAASLSAEPPSSDLRPASSEPGSNMWRRFFAGWSESASASERRARKISASTALTVSPSSAAISTYDSPFHSRMRIASRWRS